MNKQRLATIILAGVLVILSGYLITRNYVLSRDLSEANAKLASFHKNEQVANFSRMFIEKVLKSGTEVDFETRLRLENAVRDIKDEEILDSWNKFVESKNEAQAQENVKNLLDVLVRKM